MASKIANSVRLPPDLDQKLTARSQLTKRSKTRIIEIALRAYFTDLARIAKETESKLTTFNND